MKVKIEMACSAEDMLRKRGLCEGGRVQQIIDSEVLRRCEPLVPYLNHNLIPSGITGTVIGSGMVVYNIPYARYQYYGKSRSGKPLNYTTEHNREAGSFWFERMKAANRDDILKKAQEAVK